jgi:hypothetical protein
MVTEQQHTHGFTPMDLFTLAAVLRVAVLALLFEMAMLALA